VTKSLLNDFIYVKIKCDRISAKLGVCILLVHGKQYRSISIHPYLIKYCC